MEPPPFFRFIWRTKKVANGVTTEYYYSGEQYTGMHTSDGKDVGAILDASGSLYGIYYDDSTIGTDVGQTYYFVYNGQGDVIGLYNHGGKLIATYAYDAWGRCIEAKAVTADDDGHAVTDPDHIAFINPFRYRGYMYDAESGLYYLNSRYYDPETGRFINADSVMGANGDMATYNLFVYCGNNPIVRYDVGGMFWKDLISGAIHTVNTIAVSLGIDTAAIGAFFLDMQKDDDNAFYYANFDCWQQHFGYTDLYDIVFDIGTSMVAAKFEFSYNGQGYIFWAWKGDYINLGAGAELGIYYGSEPIWRVDKGLAMPMGMMLDYQGNNIITTQIENQWWCTGFNPAYQNVNANDLTATFCVLFNDSGMYKAFRSAWNHDTRWTFYNNLKVALLQF